MKKDMTKDIKRDDQLATKGDVREIVTEILEHTMPGMFERFAGEITATITATILSAIPAIVTPIVESIVSREIDKLAAMVKRGFDDVHERIDLTVTKKEFNQFRTQLAVATHSDSM